MNFGKVAVACGGYSAERAVSLDSGQCVLDALRRSGVDAHRYDPAEHSVRDFLDAGFDRLFNVLHGPGGEDGVLQGFLGHLGMPYTGSDVLATAMTLDKARTKRLCAEAGLPTPAWRTITSEQDALAAANDLGFPLFVKPVSQGSSVGMTLVREQADLASAIRAAFAIENAVLLEHYLSGAEYTVTILDGRALPSIQIETPNTFYDYQAKYESEQTQYHCPGLVGESENELARMALLAFNTMSCSGWGRVDFVCDKHGQPQLIELNTVPGMTSHSLVPMAAKAAGLDFDALCLAVLVTSFADDEVSYGA
ncbi:MAG: D-alanine--D-alanine ligase [Pseudomonadota bacterium]